MQDQPHRSPYTRPILIAAVLHSLLVLGWLAGLLTVRHSVEKSEVLLCNLAWQWRHGVFPFTPLSGFPVFVNPYGPIYTWVCHLLPWPAGQPYLGGRIVSLASTIGVSLMLGWLGARRYRSWPAGVVAAALYLTSRAAIEYGAIYRIDLLVLLFSVAGFVLAVESKGRAGLWLAALLLACAVHTKSSAIAAPVAGTIWWWRQDRRHAVWFGGWWLALSALGLALIEWRTGGTYLDHNQLLVLQWTRPFDMLARPFGPSLLWIAAFALGVSRLTAEDKDALAAERLWFLWSLGVCALTSVNRGGSWNYLLEPYAAFALLTIGVFARARPVAERRAWLPLLLLAHFLVSFIHTGLLLRTQLTAWQAYAPRLAAIEADLAPRVRAGERIAVTASDPAKDALLRLGAGSPIDLMWPERELAQQLAAEALARGQVDTVIDELDRW